MLKWANSAPTARSAATAWAEKDGTVSNTNRQVQMGRKALNLPGDTREDLWIIIELAKRLGLPWTYTHPSHVFEEMKRAMPSWSVHPYVSM